MPFAEDLTAFFAPANFGTVATFNAAQVNGIFDNPSKDYHLGLAGISDSKPTFTGRTVDLATALDGSIITINGINWTVMGNNPDSTGVTMLLLKEP